MRHWDGAIGEVVGVGERAWTVGKIPSRDHVPGNGRVPSPRAEGTARALAIVSRGGDPALIDPENNRRLGRAHSLKDPLPHSRVVRWADEHVFR